MGSFQARSRQPRSIAGQDSTARRERETRIS
jgi:hypothetical protein